ncbi:MAG: hypothetical protein ACI8PZ_001406 [Myxococcota bacterium]|jgi:hypothetical protein
MDAVQQGWSTHAADPEGTLTRLAAVRPDGPRPLAVLATLQVHILGEHLGRWADAVALVRAHREGEAYDAEDAWAATLWRLEAAMHRCAGDQAQADVAVVSAGGDARVQRIRAWAVAAPALAARGGDAGGVLAEALALGEALAPGADDPASKALAIAANNVACALEERSDRSPADTAAMKQAARAARAWWGIAGNWVNVRLAEYRLAMTHLRAGEPAVAEAHARAALALADANAGASTDRFFGWLALAEARAAQGADPGGELALAEASLPDWGDDRAWAEGELAATRARCHPPGAGR